MVNSVLPEAAAKNTSLTRLTSANANHAQLAITAADNLTERTLSKTRLCCGICGPQRKNFSALDDLAKEIITKTALALQSLDPRHALPGS